MFWVEKLGSYPGTRAILIRAAWMFHGNRFLIVSLVTYQTSLWPQVATNPNVASITLRLWNFLHGKRVQFYGFLCPRRVKARLLSTVHSYFLHNCCSSEIYRCKGCLLLTSRLGLTSPLRLYVTHWTALPIWINGSLTILKGSARLWLQRFQKVGGYFSVSYHTV